MSYKRAASGVIKSRDDIDDYHLYGINFKKGNVLYTLIPELALLFLNKNNSPIIVDPKSYWNLVDKIDSYKKNLIKNPFSAVAIVTTGKCFGQCDYCYAKNGKNITEYITPEIFDKACELNGIKGIDHTIIYGGEPLIEIDKFQTLMDHLINKWKVSKSRIGTGLFINDKTFSRLIELISLYKDKIRIFVSIDPKGDGYLRKYTGDTYSFLIERICKLLEYTDVSIRTTLNSTSGSPIDLINEIEFRTGKRVQTCIELMTTGEERFILSEDKLQNLKSDLTNYLSKLTEFNQNTVPDPIWKTYNSKNIFDAMKHCSLGSRTLSIEPDGGTTACSNEVLLGADKIFDKDVEKTYKNIFELNKDPCKKCDYKMVCGKMCHDTINAKDFEYSQSMFCDYHIFCLVEGLKLIILNKSHEEIQNICNESQKFLGLSLI